MLETKWEIDSEEGRGWTYKNPDVPGLFNFSTLDKVNKLEIYFRSYLKDQRTNGEIYQATLHHGFRPTHAVEVLKGLAAQNKIRVTSNDGHKIRKGSYYINYNEYCDRPNRLSIQLI